MMLRLARSFSAKVGKKQLYQPKLGDLITSIQENKISQKYEEAMKKFDGRILFNSVLEIQSMRLRKYDEIMGRRQNREERKFNREFKALPLVLNQLCDEPKAEDDCESDSDVEETPVYDFPYSRFVKVEAAGEPEEVEERIPKNWLQDYDLYDESEDELSSTYGTPDIKVPVSQVPCSGCGAHLHCKDGSIPGYVPSELFVGLSAKQLKTIHCQRCHFLVNYNTAINVQVKPEDYINIISTIKDKFAMAVVLVDLLDFPCSIFTGLSELLGPKRPIYIVGNKVDLIPRDHPNYLNHITKCLTNEAVKMGFEQKHIKGVSLISAKTGYGVEDLITKLHHTWEYKGDVYLVGCTNVGKSSLFNALLGSDYCKVEATDLIQRATACPWPGTTLRMLKFPILRISDFRLALRLHRINSQKAFQHENDKLRKENAQKTKDPRYATLIGHIGRSFEGEKEILEDPTSQTHQGGFGDRILSLNERSEQYSRSKWCYDTPGVIQKDQILHLLTTDEIIKTIPKEMMRARAFLIKPNFSLFLAGLGRLDYLDGPERTRVLVFSSLELPVSIVETKDADEFYESFLGSEVLGVPMNTGEERMTKWPKLEAAYEEIIIDGKEKHITVCDILLSSAGWVGINLPQGSTGKFKAWTPEKRGIYVRRPSILPYGMNLRGKRVRRSLAYLIGKAFTYKRNT